MASARTRQIHIRLTHIYVFDNILIGRQASIIVVLVENRRNEHVCACVCVYFNNFMHYVNVISLTFYWCNICFYCFQSILYCDGSFAYIFVCWESASPFLISFCLWSCLISLFLRFFSCYINPMASVIFFVLIHTYASSRCVSLYLLVCCILNILTSETYSILNPKVARQMKKKKKKIVWNTRNVCRVRFPRFVFITWHYTSEIFDFGWHSTEASEMYGMKNDTWHKHTHTQTQTFIRIVLASMILNKLQLFRYLRGSYSEIGRHYTHWNGQEKIQTDNK